MELALDHELDPVLRQEMEHRLESLRVNPLEGSPGNEVRTAGATTLRFRSRPRNMDILRSGLTTCAPRSSHSVRQPNIESLADCCIMGPLVYMNIALEAMPKT